MRAFVVLGIHPNESDIFSADSVTQGELEDYANHIIERAQELNKAGKIEVNYDDLRQVIADDNDELCDLSGNYNVMRGNSISFRDFIRLEVEDPEANALFHPVIKPGQFSSIEAQFKAAGKGLEKYFIEHTDTELHPFVASETGVNIKQFTQMASFVGLKPDRDGGVIPITITDNFLKGLSSLESYFINSKGTRKALTTNNRMTRRSGYLTRKLSLSNIDHYHDDSIEDCGTTHFLIFSVDNEKKLHQIIGRNYYDINEKNEKVSDLKTVYEDSTELIGKKIGLRSPVTCCGDHVCATCYGRELSRINKDVNTGLVATLKLTEPLTQRLLSAKHLLSTKTEKINWGETFSDFFSVNLDSIYFAPEVNCSISFKKPTAEDYDEDNEAYGVNVIYILAAGNKKAIEYKAPTTLYVNDKFLPVEKMKDDDENIVIYSKNATEDDYLFKYEVKNAELTRSLQEILDLIETSDHLGITDYNDFVNKFDDLLIENDLGYINSVHIEMISSVLIRDAETGKRLDFSKKKLNAYKLDRVSKSVLEGPLAVSLSFERLNDQLIDLDTYKKDEVSMMDNLFL